MDNDHAQKTKTDKKPAKRKASRKLLKDKRAKAHQKHSQKQNKRKDSLIIAPCIFVTAGVQFFSWTFNNHNKINGSTTKHFQII